MEEYYKKTVQKIKEVGDNFSELGWNRFAVENGLLSSETLKYLTGKDYTQLCEELKQKED